LRADAVPIRPSMPKDSDFTTTKQGGLTSEAFGLNGKESSRHDSELPERS